jgi:hypothetical protein
MIVWGARKQVLLENYNWEAPRLQNLMSDKLQFVVTLCTIQSCRQAKAYRTLVLTLTASSPSLSMTTRQTRTKSTMAH